MSWRAGYVALLLWMGSCFLCCLLNFVDIEGDYILWGPRVEDQCNGGMVAYLHHLASTHQEVQDPVTQEGVQTQGPELSDELGGHYGFKG
jgi:hypothetical protein